MSRAASVVIHSSQFPENVREDLLRSLRTRRVNHKFHYDSIKQTQKWLALHQAYSPSRADADCAAIYDRSFAGAISKIMSPKVHLFGLGCGGGQKDTRLLKLLKEQGKEIAYTPSDVSVAMVLVARQTALSVVSEENCFPFVCDLASPESIEEIFISADTRAARLFTFFGMIPNFEPQTILPRLAGLLRGGDWLLVSANLAPGTDYSAGVQKIVPLYDNALTRDWLGTFLSDLGIATSDGELRFMIEDCPANTRLKRVAADFHFNRSSVIQFPEERFEFRAGEMIRLFFSYRHTPQLMADMLSGPGIAVVEQWIAQSGEEGVFLCRKTD